MSKVWVAARSWLRTAATVAKSDGSTVRAGHTTATHPPKAYRAVGGGGGRKSPPAGPAETASRARGVALQRGAHVTCPQKKGNRPAARGPAATCAKDIATGLSDQEEGARARRGPANIGGP